MSFYREQFLAQFEIKVDHKQNEVECQAQAVRQLAGRHYSNDELCDALQQMITTMVECQKLACLKEEIEETLAEAD